MIHNRKIWDIFIWIYTFIYFPSKTFFSNLLINPEILKNVQVSSSKSLDFSYIQTFWQRESMNTSFWPTPAACWSDISQQIVAFCFWPPRQRHYRYTFYYLYLQTSSHTVKSGINHRRRRRARWRDFTTARTRSVVHPMRGNAGPLPRSAPGRPSLTHRFTSWSAASTYSGTFQVLNGPIWQNLWNWQRPRSKSGSRTADIKPNGARWRPSWWRAAHQRK